MKRKYPAIIGLVAISAFAAGLLCGRFGAERNVAKLVLASNAGTTSYASKIKAVEPALELPRTTSSPGHPFNLHVVKITLDSSPTNWSVRDVSPPTFNVPEVPPRNSEAPFIDRDFDPRARLRKGLDLFNKQYHLEDSLGSSQK